MQRYDYAVIGGGPVGAVMALGLAGQGHSVALLERSAPHRVTSKLGVDPRTVALSAKSRELLEKISAWPGESVSGFENMEVWEDLGTSVLRFGAADVDQQVLGHIAEVSPWIAQLWSQLESSAVSCFTGHTLTTIDSAGDDWQLESVHSERVGAQSFLAGHVIAADGANSVVRSSLSVAMEVADTGQSALAFAAQMEHPHERTAFQRFLADGPLALLPLADEHLVSVVWSANNARADELSALSVDGLARELELACEARLGKVQQVVAPARFPLRQGVISNFAPAPGVIFVGDAARVVHPLAGQGVNLGFEDVAALLECSDGSAGRIDQRVLRRFARLRKARSKLALGVISALSAAYAPQTPAMLMARNALTRAIGEVDSVRAKLVLEAMGLGVVARSS